MAEHRDKPHWAERAARWLQHNWFVIGSPVGGLLIAIASVPSMIALDAEESKTAILGPWGWQQVTLAVGVALVVASLIGQLLTHPTYSELYADREHTTKLAEDRSKIMESMLASMLSDVCKSSGLTGFEYRASLYCHGSASFILLVRMSDNPDLAVHGRPSYPEHEGVIGKAWSKGSAALVDLPVDRPGWNAQMVEHGLNSETVEKLRMQSRSIVGIRIDDPARSPAEPVGVLVLESLAPRGVHGRTIDRVAQTSVWPLLVSFMVQAREHFPALARTVLSVDQSAVRHRRKASAKH